MAKSQIATAYVQVVPSMDGVAPKVRSVFSSAGTSSGSAFGSNLVSKIKGLIAAAGIGKTFTDAIMSGSDLEQLKGGVQKIFDEMDTATIMADAANAYRDLNMSANQYLATINDVGATFAATMGDEKGYSVARTGLQAISDYATGTGKSVDLLSDKFTMITRSTSSYQSIADQFSGILPATSAGFLEQAQAAGILSSEYTKLTEVPIDEYQQAVAEMLKKGTAELGLAGNTAAETATTFAGSLAAMKAAYSNFLGALATGEDIGPALNILGETIVTFISGNLIPMVSNIVSALPEVFTGVFDTIGAELTSRVPELAFIFENLETVVISLTAAMVAYKTASAISGVIDTLRAATEGQTIAQTLLNAVMNANPFVLVATLAAGLVAAIITLWNTNEGFRSAVTSAWETVKSTVSAVVDALVGFFTGTVPNAINTLVTGVTSIPGKISSIFQSFSWGSIGSNIISGIARGISSGASAIISAAQSAARAALNAAKRFLGIASPSKVMRDQVGKFIPEGMAIGIEANTKPLTDAMHDLSNLTTSTAQADIARGAKTTGVPVSASGNVYGNSTITINVYASDNMDVDELAETIMQRIQFAVSQREVCFA